MRTILVYSPFCTPATPPYSITYLYQFLKDNVKSGNEISALDLNLEFHLRRFPKFKEYVKNLNRDYDRTEYEKRSLEHKKETEKVYSENNRKVVDGKAPELIDEMLGLIMDKKPDIAAFSIVYSSQAFYTFSLINELKKKGVKTVIGGPAVNEKLIKIADASLGNEVELLEFIQGHKADHDKLNCDTTLDFSTYKLKNYFSPRPVIPLRTSSTCYYRKCTFCSHYNQKSHYFEFPIKNIVEAIKKSGQRHFFLIDDMIHKKRLLELAKEFKQLSIKWTCQLRPTKEFDLETLKTLNESGLNMVMWGIESGSDRILGLIRKGTNADDISDVLKASHKAGIKNIAYIIFGFPTETKEEFLQTIDFLKKNDESIDLVSMSIFGLHRGTYVYLHPEEFGIKKINEEERTVLEPKITYEVNTGLSNEEANELRGKYKRTIEKINKYPKTMNFFREHMFTLLE